MLIESLVVAGIAAGIYAPVNKSMKLDEKAMQKCGKAFEKAKSAQIKVKNKAEFADKRATNVANKKRTIINFSLQRFMEVYEKIQKIERKNKQQTKIIEISDFSNLNWFITIPIASLQGFTTKQLICSVAVRGIVGTMVKESEQKLSAAKNTMNYARVYESQAESMIVIYDAIIERADRISDLLVKMNILFLRSIEETNRVINTNGTNVENYSEFDFEVLRTCVNIADAIIKLLDIPVVDEQGKLVEEAVTLIEKGQTFLNEMKSMM